MISQPAGVRTGVAPENSVPVGLGAAVVGGPGSELIAFGLGSCIGLAVWSPSQQVGVLCHIVLPDSGGAPADPSTPAKYADQAVAWAVQALTARGARPSELVAKLAGGAQVLSFPLAADIGRRNTAATLAALQAHGVSISGSSTGGTVGRTVRFYPQSGAVEVRPIGGPGVTL